MEILIIVYSLLVLGCDGVVGSLSKYDACGVCEGDNSTCRLVSGLFTKPHLPPGTNHITTIPLGACSLNISFLRPNNNHFALHMSDKTYLINKPGVLSLTGPYKGAGTVFFYTRGDQATREHLTADGPIEMSVELELSVSDINRGIEYRYMVPLAEEDKEGDMIKQERKQPGGHKRRHTKQQYRWTLKTLTQCSRSCGGGYQRTIALCVKKSGHRVVPDRKCEQWSKPTPRTVRCNRNPCPAKWMAGDWSSCTTSCGAGIQKRRIACKQELSENLSIPVAEELCSSSHNFVTERQCYVKACDPNTEGKNSTVLASEAKDDLRYLYQNYEAKSNFNYLKPYTSKSSSDRAVFPYSVRNPPKYAPKEADSQVDNNLHSSQISLTADWVAQPWGPCSVTCGSGLKERRVHCVDTRGGLVPDSRCKILSRPDSEAYCNAGPCVTNTWLVSQWDVCSAQCGAGEIHRKVTCVGECDEVVKPHVKEDCHAPKPCKGEWLTGRWTVCSHSCGDGTQSRTVECTTNTQGGTQIATEENCADRRKPKIERQCNIQACVGEWYTTDWSECSQECGHGERTREVVCLHNNNMSDQCSRGDMPEKSEECEKQMCVDADGNEKDDKEEDAINEDNDYEIKSADESLYLAETTTSKPETTKHRSFISNEILPEKHWKVVKGEGCKDKFKNCNVVVQSRLCKYSFYQTNCCRSCMFLHKP